MWRKWLTWMRGIVSALMRSFPSFSEGIPQMTGGKPFASLELRFESCLDILANRTYSSLAFREPQWKDAKKVGHHE